MNGVRFAPSPTGRFHVGNLRTAWISHQWARALGQPWVLRFEDIDAPRVQPGAQATQLADMKALGLEADRVYVQSSRRARHWELFLRGVREAWIYPCVCSRQEVQRDLAAIASAPHAAPAVYAGTCRAGLKGGAQKYQSVAWRLRALDLSGAGDVIVARTASLLPDEASFVPAYHWACAIDDMDGDYALLVRAWDLAESAVPQRAIQKFCGAASSAAIFHCALVLGDNSERLEKRTQGVTWPELQQQGYTVQRLLTAFAASFASGVMKKPSPGATLGEERHKITLSQLLPALP